MAVEFKAAIAMHWFGVDYAAGDTVDTTSYGPEDLARLVKHAPVYAVETGGSATVGAPIVRAFPFAFDTPNLVTGHTVWTPAVGDMLIDAWIEVTSAWNGTTPKGDFAQFIGGDTNGCFEDQDAGVDLTVADTTDGVAMPAGLLYQAHPGSQPASLLSMQANSAGSPRAVRPQRRVPAKFTTADPVKVVVTQDGTKGGTDTGATAGAAVLYLVTCTPAT